MSFNGIVLTGGSSSRMGTDKAQIQYHNKPEYQRMVELLMPFCKEIVISCREEQKNSYPGYRLMFDNKNYSQSGPIGGLLTVMAETPGPWLVTACDYPGFGLQDIHHLLSNRQTTAVATIFKDPASGYLEPLLGIYETVSMKLLLNWFAKGNQSLSMFHKNHNSATLEPLNTESILHADTPEEMEKWKRRFTQN